MNQSNVPQGYNDYNRSEQYSRGSNQTSISTREEGEIISQSQTALNNFNSDYMSVGSNNSNISYNSGYPMCDPTNSSSTSNTNVNSTNSIYNGPYTQPGPSSSEATAPLSRLEQWSNQEFAGIKQDNKDFER